MRHILLLALVACQGGSDWNRKDAYRRCAGMIAAYPDRPAPPCQVLSMCVDEGVLSAAERTKLYEIMDRSGCPEL